MGGVVRGRPPPPFSIWHSGFAQRDYDVAVVAGPQRAARCEVAGVAIGGCCGAWTVVALCGCAAGLERSQVAA